MVAGFGNPRLEMWGIVVAECEEKRMDTARLHLVNMDRAPKRQRTCALCALLVASLLLLSACATSAGGSSGSQASADPTATLPAKWHGVNPGAGVPTVTPPANPAPRPLPAFSDPRVAYIGPDSLLHVVSLDGKTNLAGTPIPLTGTSGRGYLGRWHVARWQTTGLLRGSAGHDDRRSVGRAENVSDPEGWRFHGWLDA